MELETLCEGLRDALERWDEEILPLGLYASDELPGGTRAEYPEWPSAIEPFLSERLFAMSESRGRGRRRSSINRYFLEGATAPGGLAEVRVEIVRCSTVKVRRYGSGYQVDIHTDREHHWHSADLSGRISALWKQPDFARGEARAQVLVFVGFDKSPEPFGRELRALEQKLKWSDKGAAFATRMWQDKAKRGFGVRLAVWARLDSGA